MQMNKYLQYIVRKEAQSETETLDQCLRTIKKRKQDKLQNYLTLIIKRMSP